jgi:prophage tail gpP-like protein
MGVRIDESDVELILAGQNISYNETYAVKMGVFEVPNTFDLTFGWGQSMGGMLENVVQYSPFELRIGGRPGFKGRLGKIGVVETSGSAMKLGGRDVIADLARYKIDSNVTFSKSTYVGLLEEVLKRIGVNSPVIVGNYAELANKRTGVSVNRFKLVLDPVTDTFFYKESISEINSNLKAKTGMTWLSFLQEYFNRAGLFLWSGPNGEYVLSRPNPNQPPSYRLVRGRDAVGLNVVNVKLIEYERSIEDRHAYIRVNGRAGGTKAGRSYFLGQAEDEEMIKLGFQNFRAVRDRTVTTPKQAEDLARRIRAEERRKGFKLVYQAAGHRGITPQGAEAVYSPDTTVQLDDYELDLHGVYYLEDCSYERSVADGTVTKLSLMRTQDLVF